MATRRRTRGEGTIRRRPDGQWEVKVSRGVDPETGRRRRLTRVRATRAEALAALQELQALGAGVFSRQARAPLAVYLEANLERLQAHQLRPSTLQRYRHLLRRWILPHAPAVPLADVTPQHVEEWLAAMRDAGAGGRTLEMCFTWIRKTLGSAAEAGLLPDNPVKAQHRPRHRAGRMLFLDVDELGRFLAEARKEPAHAPLWPLLAVAGLRLGEALALRWSAVHLTEGTLDVVETLVELDHGFEFGPPKTERSERTVHLGAHLTAALRAYREERAEAVSVFGDALVFCTRDGGPLARRNVRRRLHVLLDRAQCQRVRVHDLRHTAATYLLGVHGLPPPVVAETLGHSVETLLRTYAHVLTRNRTDAAAAMDLALEQGER